LAIGDRALAAIDSFRQAGGVIKGESIDWQRYMKSDDKSRVVPAESLAEKAKERLMLGAAQESGLTLPWPKTHGRVLLRPGKVAVWAGWTHHGKTQMVKQVMLHGVSNSERVLIASMEEEVTDVYCDMAVMACGSQEPRQKDLTKFTEFVTGKLWLYDQQGQIDPMRMNAVIRYAAAELKITQVVIDSLMMLQMPRDDYDAQSRFVSQLHSTAKDTGVTVHLVAHMRKRDGKGGDESVGTIHDISGGHEIGSMVDYVLLPWRDKKKDARPNCQLKIEKQRGRINWLGTIDLNFHQTSRQFVEDVMPMRFWRDEAVNF
jgi:twinkle protein